MNYGETGLWPYFDQIFQNRSANPFPEIVQPGPGRNAMNVGKDLNHWKGHELIKVQVALFFHQAEYPQAPP